MTRWLILIGLTAFASRGALAQSRSVGFVQFEAPSLHVDDIKPTVREGAHYVDNATTLGWAVLEANRIELQHRLDFAVIAVDFAVFQPDPHVAAAELARFARGLTVARLYILAGPC